MLNCVNTRATRVQEQVKERRYRDAATLAGMLLHDLAIEVYWARGNDFTKMFTHFVSLGAVVNQSYPQRYIRKLLAKTDFGLSSAWSRKCD